jgi:hypothetical protein
VEVYSAFDGVDAVFRVVPAGAIALVAGSGEPR